MDGIYTALSDRKDELSKEIESIKEQSDVLIKTSAVLKHVIDMMVNDEIKKMAGLISYGLKTVFEDQNISFTPVITKKNDRIHIELITEKDGIKGEFGSFGGSVAVIESFLLRILSMLKLKLGRLMLLDETFASVGGDYIPSTSLLVSQLAQKLGLDVLLVTHKKEFETYADQVFRATESPHGLVIERTK